MCNINNTKFSNCGIYFAKTQVVWDVVRVAGRVLSDVANSRRSFIFTADPAECWPIFC